MGDALASAILQIATDFCALQRKKSCARTGSTRQDRRVCKIALRGARTWHGVRGNFAHAVNISISAMRAESRRAKPRGSHRTPFCKPRGRAMIGYVAIPKTNNRRREILFHARTCRPVQRTACPNIERLRKVYRTVQLRLPFETNAICILPDYLHAIWTLPPGDADFASRWSQIKSGFSRGLAPARLRSRSQLRRRETGIGSDGFGSTQSEMTRTSSVTSITSTTIR